MADPSLGKGVCNFPKKTRAACRGVADVPGVVELGDIGVGRIIERARPVEPPRRGGRATLA